MMRFLIPHLHNSPSNKFQDNEAEVEEPSALLIFRLFNNSGTIRVAFSWKQPIQAITAIATGRSQTSCISLINLNLHNYIGTYIHYIKIGDSHLVSDCFYIYKWLGIKKIGVIFKMTNENVRLDSSFFSYKNTTTFYTCNPFFQLFSLFYILSYQSDNLTSTKNRLSNTNPPESPSKMTKKNVRFH